MKKLNTVYLALLLAFGMLGVAQAAPIEFNGHYYEYVYGAFTWDQANDLASSAEFNGVTGHLVTITSESENDFVSSINSGWAMTGAKYDKGIDSWGWITGEDFSGYTNWEDGYPKQYDGWYFGAMLAGKWRNTSPVSGNSYIIEYEPSPAPIPEPSTFLLLGAGLLGMAGVGKKFKKA
ncbi:MAG: PEP-CTERM sorting domain-containing protein [Desulfobacteraceae bacterium]|nr:PEP-CTERM sorting domain-containing protein [Desulfobacteraceae bacterium]